MKLPDDMLPEEKDPGYEELITLLQQANLNPMLVDPTERAQILSRARARLFQTDPEVSKPEEMPVLEVSELDSFPSKPKALADKQHRGRRLIRLVNELAAVLVVLALIGSALLLFWHRLPSTGDHPAIAPPIGPVGAPVVVYAGVAGGFEMSLKITPGPYFLSELLETDLSITNHTHTDSWLFTRNGPSCLVLLNIVTAGGRSPYATDIQHYWTGLPRNNIFTCNWPSTGVIGPIASVKVPATRTITIKQFVQLTSSGHVTLTAHVAFRKTTNEFGWNDPHAISVDASVVSLHLSVSALVPSDRRLSIIKEQGAQVIVYVPPAARGHLLSAIGFTCSRDGETGAESMGDHRISQPTMTLQKPECTPPIQGNKLLWWTFFAGAPGYAMVSGKYP